MERVTILLWNPAHVINFTLFLLYIRLYNFTTYFTLSATINPQKSQLDSL